MASPTNGSGGPLTDRLNVSFTWRGITSTYHIFADGLDLSKEVGFLLYTDGSGAYGLKNPNQNYLLDADGTTGLRQVARKHNMLLLTPTAPPPSDSDGDNCWYNTTGTPNATTKSDWLRALVDQVYAQYPIERERVAIGGYSSGAQGTTRWFVPRHGPAVQKDGVFVAIAYGGTPAVSNTFTQEYKERVVGVWNTGTSDSAYSTASYGARGGESWYRSNGFTTDPTWPSGLGHSRSDFDIVMDQAITEHVRPAAPVGGTTPPPVALPHADYLYDPTSGDAPLTVTFDNISTGATSYRWDFGDGATSTAAEPGEHTFAQAGTYQVTLTATNSAGSDSITGAVTVTGAPQPVDPPFADYWYDPVSGQAPLTVRFTDKSVGATSYLWEFGDGDTSTEASPTHVYTAAGTYHPRLTVSNPGGSASISGTVTVSAAPASAAYAHSIVPRATGATLTVDIPAGAQRLTWRMSKDPITTQTGFYDYTDAEGEDVVVNTSSTLLRNTVYNYQLESGSRSNVVASGTFRTLA